MIEVIVVAVLMLILLMLLGRVRGEHPYERWGRGGYQPSETVDKDKIVPPPPPGKEIDRG